MLSVAVDEGPWEARITLYDRDLLPAIRAYVAIAGQPPPLPASP